MRAFAILGLLLVSAPGHAAAEPPVVVVLTLAEARERALAASGSLAALAALERAAEAEVSLARSRRWPQLEAHAGYQRRSEVPELSTFIPEQGIVTIFPNIQDNTSLQLSASVPLYAGGGIAAGVEAAAARARASERERAGGVADLLLETTSAYWALVTARGTQAVLEESLAAFQAHLEDARNRERFGLAARNEVLAVSVERDHADLRRLRAANAAAVAEADLVRLTGLEPGTRIETVEPPEPPGDLPAAGTQAVPDALLAETLARRPELAQLNAQIAAAEAVTRAERASRLPQVRAEAAWDYANPNRQILPFTATWQDTWHVGVGVSFTVLDGGGRASAVAAAQARTEALRARLRDLERGIRLEVTRAWLDARAEREALDVAERALESARENLRVAGDRHAAGLIPSAERLDAEVALQRSGLDRTEALARLRLARARLERALGRDAPQPEAAP